MSSVLKRALSTLAILLVACAQVFGMDRGFVCDCGGMEKITAADHCHGPHSAACHDHEAEEPCHEESGGHHDGDTHEHPALIESLLASLSPAFSFSAPAPIIMDLALEEWHSPLFLTEAAASTAVHSEHPPPAAQRPWPQLLARTLVLRI
ncbi:hypothetical protein [Prosthecobacter vanneervenii]|uniref:Uncharacterized protein n=1 Tax=Prosthecobacter vanneervenii TaxID=48466 RepID=A0A7W7Y7P6_9BACT|nr:hypothetical protein [Prosthecobacter vanneervenii]MBB5031168.1 hypothetical protein [Prosthecobacter vanneervenii]